MVPDQAAFSNARLRIHIGGLSRPDHLTHHVQWPPLDLTVDAPNVLPKDAQQQHLHAAQDPREPTAYCESEASPATACSRLKELVEDALHFTRSHPHAGVGHSDRHAASVRHSESDSDASSVGEPDGVGDQIEHDLPQACRVCPDSRDIRWVEFHRDSLGGRLRFQP